MYKRQFHGDAVAAAGVEAGQGRQAAGQSEPVVGDILRIRCGTVRLGEVRSVYSVGTFDGYIRSADLFGTFGRELRSLDMFGRYVR